MKKWMIGLAYLLSYFPIQAQPEGEADFPALTQQFQAELALYQHISTTSRPMYSIQSLGMHQAIRAQAREDLWVDSDDVILNRFDALLAMQYQLLHTLKVILQHPQSSSYAFEQLQDSTGNFRVVISADRKLVHFTLEDLGDTHSQSRMAIYHYRSEEGPDIQLFPNFDPLDLTVAENPFFEDGYQDIYQLQTEMGIQYLMVGKVQAYAGSFDQYVSLVTIDEGNVEVDFSYTVTTETPDSAILFDPANRWIEVQYETSNLTTTCSCQTGQDTSGYTREFVSKRCSCRFQFQDGRFELVDMAEEKVDTR